MTQEALQYIREGNVAVYESLYTEYFKKFFNYGRNFTTNPATVEDSIQEVFFDIWQKRAVLPPVHSLNSYLFSAFRHILLRRLKREGRTVLAEVQEAGPDFSVEQKLVAAEEGAAVREKMQQAINALTPRQREAIFLRFYENLSYEEMVVVMGITVKATYKVVARALESLKEKMTVSPIVLLLLPVLYFMEI